MRLTNIKALFKHLLSPFTPPEAAPLSEEERLLAEIEETRKKMDYAWKRLDYADPEYVEIAVLELLLVETQYGILNKRYRLLLGMNDENPYLMPTDIEALSTSLAKKCRGHAFYGCLLNTTPEPPPSMSATPQLMSPASHQS